MDPPSRKRGRPRVVVTEVVAAARREAARQRVAARRRGAPSETPLRRKNINLRKTAFASVNAKHDLETRIRCAGFAERMSGRMSSLGDTLVRARRRTQFVVARDGQEAVDHRLSFSRTRGALDPDIVAALLQMLTRVNALVHIFKQVWERFPPSNQTPVRLKLLERRSSDGRYVNMPRLHGRQNQDAYQDWDQD
ncbi:hypothetical protein POM88_014838 [Heracleum sosnowskyi]|uniref:Uncharacterized protein n=1 Tax=Heracleum sosnowskyi TaxID=360622 RepID=A0AAD8IJ29_9APIA|nr:hypothetical protein POM88_014838 [Heracleum sosnowskyi]